MFSEGALVIDVTKAKAVSHLHVDTVEVEVEVVRRAGEREELELVRRNLR
jgi:hypothetical protein